MAKPGGALLADAGRIDEHGAAVPFDPCTKGFQQADGPFCQIAHIDELHEAPGLARRQYFAALAYAPRPVGEAVGGIVRASDQPGADHQAAPGESMLGFGFAQGL